MAPSCVSVLATQLQPCVGVAAAAAAAACQCERPEKGLVLGVLCGVAASRILVTTFRFNAVRRRTAVLQVWLVLLIWCLNCLSQSHVVGCALLQPSAAACCAAAGRASTHVCICCVAATGWVRPSVCPADSHIATCCMPSTTQQEPTVARKRLTYLFASELTDRCWRAPLGGRGRQGRQARGHAQEGVAAACVPPGEAHTCRGVQPPSRQRQRCGGWSGRRSRQCR